MPSLPEWLRLVLAVFTCYRLTQFVVYDEGPGSIFLKGRNRAGCYDYGENGQPKTALGHFLKCPFCVGVWMALICADLVLWPSFWIDALLIWMGIAGAQAYLEGRNDVER